MSGERITKYFRDRAYVDGKWVEADTKKTISVKNPATGETIGTQPNCGPAETNRAIDAAKRALPAWRSLSAFERSEKLYSLYSLIKQHQEELGRLLTIEQGKPLAEAKGEINYGASYILWYAEEAKRVYGDLLPSSARTKRISVLREPVGVCGAITPWNFPQSMLARKMAPALAAGCTFIAKPDDKTPYSVLALAALCEEAGIPPGVFNVVTGEAPPIAKALMDSDIVRKVSFTGSTRVGKLLIEQSAATLKKMTLELGGNAPFIVFADADLERAASQAVFGKFRNAGQTCVCVNRFVVERSIAPKFSELLISNVKKLKVGNGLEPDVTVGPLIAPFAVKKVCELMDDAVSHGAKVTHGKRPDESSLFVPPIVLENASQSMRIAKEEVFGPLAAIFPFDTEQEAINMANDTEYGLASYFYTRDVSRVHRVQEALEYGMIGVNESAISSAEVPFGGVKHSGFGREGGRYGIDEYCHIKYVCLGI